MASKTQDQLFEDFQTLAAGLELRTQRAFDSEQNTSLILERVFSGLKAAAVSAPDGEGRSADAIPSSTKRISSEQEAAPARRPESPIAPESTASGQPAASSSGIGNTVLSIASKVFGSGLGLVPLIGGLLDLFGGGPESPPPLVKYVMPERQFFTGGVAGGGFVQADYDQAGMPRLYSFEGGGAAPGTVPPGNPGAAGAPASVPQINVNVQAMDAQSFLDHSYEIAKAVRSAMLNLSPINDVVNDL